MHLRDPSAPPLDEAGPSTVLPPREVTFAAEIRERIKKHGGSVIFGFQFARLLGCIGFFVLCIVCAIVDEETRLGANILGKKHKKKRHRDEPALSQKEWQDLAMCMTSVRPLSAY